MAQAERSPMQHIDAEEYFNKILKGHKNALTRPLNPTTDRVLRKLVEDANKHGDCIINSGNGYYRPDPADEVDILELNNYLASELKRARSIQIKRLAMKKAFEEEKELGLFTSDKREVE